MDTKTIIIQLIYLLAAICFIIGLRRLSSPATARSGNQVAAVGMALWKGAALLAKLVTTLPPLPNVGSRLPAAA